MTAPYYSDDSVTLYLGDCLQVDAWLKADVLITDPPYGIGGALSAGHKGRRPAGGFAPVHADQGWDGTLDVRDAALEAWGGRPYAVFGSPKRLDAMVPHREVPLIWDKGELVGMGDLTFPWRVNYEVIYVSGGDWSGSRTSTAVLRYPLSNRDAGRIGHPTPKPLGLMGNLIERAPVGVVADPFAGSGSTLIAAKERGRRAVGVEMDERYCEIAAKRLSQGVLDFGGAA